MTRSALLARALIVAGALTLTLSGCLPSDPADTPESPASIDEASTDADPTPSPSDSALPDDALFRITATVTVPGGTAVLTETVLTPRASTPLEESTLDAEGCDSWRGFAAPAVQDVHFAATVTSGTWPTNTSWIVGSAGSWATFSGDFATFQAYCSPSVIGIPGIASALHVFSGAGADSTEGWATNSYGFVAGAGEEAEVVDPNAPVITDCQIELGPQATSASALVTSWPTTIQEIPASTCLFGG
jgi:hypothetical protein